MYSKRGDVPQSLSAPPENEKGEHFERQTVTCNKTKETYENSYDGRQEINKKPPTSQKLVSKFKYPTILIILFKFYFRVFTQGPPPPPWRNVERNFCSADKKHPPLYTPECRGRDVFPVYRRLAVGGSETEVLYSRARECKLLHRRLSRGVWSSPQPPTFSLCVGPRPPDYGLCSLASRDLCVTPRYTAASLTFANAGSSAHTVNT